MNAKHPQTNSGNTIEQLEFDRRDANKIYFSEIMVFLCLMAYSLKENLVLDRGLTQEQEAEWL